MTRSGRQLVFVLLGMLFVAASPAMLNYVKDPYQVFRKSKLGLTALHSNNRVQAAGLIKSYLADPQSGFDTVTIGTSLGQNFVPSMVQHYLGSGRVLKLNMPGAQGSVQLFVVKRALKESTLKTVLWELDIRYAEPNPTDVEEIATFPQYLYGNSWADQRQTLLNADMFADAIDALLQTPETIAYDDWNAWYNRAAWEQSRRQHLEPVVDTLEKKALAWSVDKRLTMKDLLAAGAGVHLPLIDRITQVVRARPDVRFEFFFPPRSALDYVSRESLPGMFYLQYYATRQLAPLSNATLHGFDDLPEIVLDLNNYKDPSHYGPHINERILQAIARDSNVVDETNVESYLRRRVAVLNQVLRLASTRHAMVR